jgi:hypothetical protein
VKQFIKTGKDLPEWEATINKTHKLTLYAATEADAVKQLLLMPDTKTIDRLERKTDDGVTLSERWQQEPNGQDILFHAEGKYARAWYPHQREIEVRQEFNGSSPEMFGGANDWWALGMTFRFPSSWSREQVMSMVEHFQNKLDTMAQAHDIIPRNTIRDVRC